ncbi:polymer-forming cytoskeletal protein [Paraburkholderia sp. BR10872]|uniref:polymer-forming cytoskeletal protein n=1 Tax=Paraburkholderia sp. BR10872 TaxID=3236989 RepID=UPI0034D1E0C3
MSTTVRTDIMQAVTKGKDIGTVFPVEAKFNGNLEIDEHFVIKGVFRGNITQAGLHSLLIGNTGGVHGNVRSHQLIVGGLIEGDVCANEVIILETGRIIGNVTYEKLAIELGGEVNGRIQKEVFNVVAGQPASTETAGQPVVQPGGSESREGTASNARPVQQHASPMYGGLHAVANLPRQDYVPGGAGADWSQGAGGASGQINEAHVA